MSSSAVKVVAVGPAAAATVVSRWRGQLRVTAVAKATFGFAANGEMPLLPPVAIVAGEVHHGKNPTRSIMASSELAPHLERVDVLFCGHAHAASDAPAPRVPVRLALATDGGVLLDKRLEVIGDRASAAAPPKPFQKMPIVYERALGGPGFADNPIGVGKAAGGGPLPNVVHADAARAGETAGFGPIAASWPQRKRLLEGYPPKSLQQPIAEIPDELSWTYFQAAPKDQQLDHLPPRAWIVLEGVHPKYPMLQMRLPPVRAVARILAGEGQQTLELGADTLFIDADAEHCTVCWRGSVPVAGADDLANLVVAIGIDALGQPLAWPPDAELLASARAGTARLGEPGGVTGTVVIEDAPGGTAAQPLTGTLTIDPDASPASARLPFGRPPRDT